MAFDGNVQKMVDGIVHNLLVLKMFSAISRARVGIWRTIAPTVTTVIFREKHRFRKSGMQFYNNRGAGIVVSPHVLGNWACPRGHSECIGMVCGGCLNLVSRWFVAFVVL